MRSRYLDKLLERFDDLDESQLISLIERLKDERHFFKLVLNSIREGILVIDKTGMIEYANPTVRKMIGIPESETNSVLWKLIPDLAKIFFDEKGNFKEDHLLLQEFEISYPEFRIIRLQVIPLNENDKQLWLLIFTDITQDKQNNEERIAQERVSSIFLLAAEVAHELGNPLNSIHIHLELIQRQLKLSEKSCNLKDLKSKVGRSTEVCVQEIKRLNGIVKNFLQAIRPQAIVFSSVDIVKTIEDILTLLEKELKNLGISVDIQISNTVPSILVDENQIKQVFFNILKNSMESMNKGGKITITISSNDVFLKLSFCDEGIGISQEVISQIFNSKITSKSNGNGLGMTIAQRIMRAHGGTINIESKPSVGTVVSLNLPLEHKRFKMLANPKSVPELTS